MQIKVTFEDPFVPVPDKATGKLSAIVNSHQSPVCIKFENMEEVEHFAHLLISGLAKGHNIFHYCDEAHKHDRNLFQECFIEVQEPPRRPVPFRPQLPAATPMKPTIEVVNAEPNKKPVTKKKPAAKKTTPKKEN